MVTVGCPRIVLKTEPDPLTIPPPVFRLPRCGLRDQLIDRAEQSFTFRLIQSPSLVPAKTGSAGVYRRMRVESSGSSPARRDPPRAGNVRGTVEVWWKCAAGGVLFRFLRSARCSVPPSLTQDNDRFIIVLLLIVEDPLAPRGSCLHGPRRWEGGSKDV